MAFNQSRRHRYQVAMGNLSNCTGISILEVENEMMDSETKERRVQAIAVHMMSGNKFTPTMIMHRCLCSKKEAVELLEQATNRMEAQLNAKEVDQ